MIMIIFTAASIIFGIFSAWRLLKKYRTKLAKYYEVIAILCRAIEAIELRTDLIPDKAAGVAKALKTAVASQLSPDQKAAIDQILEDLNYKKKGGK